MHMVRREFADVYTKPSTCNTRFLYASLEAANTFVDSGSAEMTTSMDVI
jgi:hypothetical protein